MKTLYKYIGFTLLVLNTGVSFGQLILQAPPSSVPTGDHKDYNSVTMQPPAVGSGVTGLVAPGVSSQTIHLYIDKSIPQPITGSNGGNNYSNGTDPSTPITSTLNTSLPVGETPNSHGVTPTGGASYNIPITLPPGTAGMVPNLSVTYNSQSAEGLLGIGWNLSGLHSIGRMTKTIYHNGYVDHVNLDNTDWFSYDGNRLVSNSGNNGDDGTTYSTEAETFSRTTSHGTYGNGPEWFSVETKDGMTMEFGNSNDSRLIPTGQTNPTIMTWMVSKIYDNYGNYISFQYNNTNGEIFIREIDYTGNSNAGISPYNIITFTYGTKTESNSVYCAQSQMNSTALLTNIQISCQGNLFQQYSFNYVFSNIYSYLTEIDEEGADKSTLNPLKFSYCADLTGNPGYSGPIYGDPYNTIPAAPLAVTTPYTTSSNPFPFSKFALLDYNGDGKEDVIDFQGAYTDVSPTTFYSNLQWALGTTLSFSWQNPILLKNTTSGLQATPTFSTQSSANIPAWDPSQGSQFVSLPLNPSAPGNLGQVQADFNADGREDVASSVVTKFSTETVNHEDADYEEDISIGLSNTGSTTSTSLFTTPAAPLVTYGSNASSYVGYGYSGTFFLDLNGDRQMDVFNYHVDPNSGTEFYRIWLNAGANNPALSVVAASGNTVYPNTSTTSPNFEIIVGEIAFSFFGGPYFEHLDFSQAFPMDLDGDGKNELVNVYEVNIDGSRQRVIVKFDFTQSGNGSNHVTAINGSVNSNETADIPAIPGNGIVIEPDNSPFTYYLNSYTTTVNTHAYPNSEYSTTLTASANYSLFGDFNGDGISDVLYYNSSSGQWSMNYGKGDGNYSTSSTNGLPNDNPFNYPTVWYYAHDMNGDGKTDIVEFTNASGPATIINVFYSTGNSFIQGPSTSASIDADPQRDQVSFGDFNGDGIDDLFIDDEFNSSNVPIIIYFNKGGFAKYLNSAVDGYGNRTQYSYQPLTIGNSVYTQPNTLGYRSTSNSLNVLDVNVPLFVVSQLTIPDGIGGLNTTTYSYADALLNYQGKGFLGFRNMTSQNNVSGYTTSTEYTFDGIFLNPINASSSTVTTSGSTPVSQTGHDLVDIGLGAISGYPFQRFFPEPDIDVEFNNVSGGFTSTSYNRYDSYGNITDMDVQNSAQVTETQNTYIQAGAWIPSRISSTIITNTRTSQPAYQRETDYNFNSNGQVIAEIKDPSTSEQLTTNYTFDPNIGILKQMQVSASGLPTAITSYQYDPLGQFVVQTTNPLGQISTATYDPKWGKPISQTDIDGLVTTFTYDGYGKPLTVTTPDNLTTNTSYSWVQSGDANLVGNPVDPTELNTALYVVTNQKPGSSYLIKYYDTYERPLLTITNGFGNTLFKVTTYTNRGSINEQSESYDKANASYDPIVTTFSYNAFEQPTQSIVRNYSSYYNGGSINNTETGTLSLTTNITYSYPLNNGVVKITTSNPDGEIRSTTTDMAGLVIQSTDNDQNNITTKTYGSLNKLTSISLNTGSGNVQLTSEQYDQYGMPTSVTDNNGGITQYEYNAYGQLVKQTDANGATFTYKYDVMGRVTTKTSPDGNYSYQYVTSGNGLNMLSSVSSPYFTTCSYTYDNLRRITEMSENINGTLFNTSYQYDAYNRLSQETYPSGFAIKNTYTSNGLLFSKTRVDNNDLIWLGFSNNPYGQYDNYLLGNGLSPSKAFTDLGMPYEYTVPGIQALTYSVDNRNGDVLSRTDNVMQNSESFNYYPYTFTLENSQASKTVYPFTTQTATNLTYQPNGNINSKSDIDPGYNYQYNSTRQNAVTQVGNANGLISPSQQSISYTPFRKASVITQDSYEADFTYGPMDDRYEMDIYNGSQFIKTRYYVGDYEKTVDGYGNTTEVHYIKCGGSLTAMYVIQNGVGSMYYTHTDNLGSILAVTDNNGNIVTRQNFDAWGNYRNPTDWSYNNIPTQPCWLYRGYTGQEHLPEFALINMNARMYDPLIGRFLGPDPLVMNSNLSQDLNRYSYCHNNPMKFTDPSGKWIWVLVGAIVGGYTGGAWEASNQGDKNWWNPFTWNSNDWQAAGVGAIIGATAGLAGETFGATAGSTGFVGSGGATTTGFNIVANGLWTADINMFSTWAQGGFNTQSGSISSIFQSGVIGFVAGAIGGEAGNPNDPQFTNEPNQPFAGTVRYTMSNIQTTNLVTAATNGFLDRVVLSREKGDSWAQSLTNGGIGAVEGMFFADVADNPKGLFPTLDDGQDLPSDMWQVSGNSIAGIGGEYAGQFGGYAWGRFLSATVAEAGTSVPGLGVFSISLLAEYELPADAFGNMGGDELQFLTGLGMSGYPWAAPYGSYLINNGIYNVATFKW